jgi:Na+/H+-translocating membrane pyrophosphatase
LAETGRPGIPGWMMLHAIGQGMAGTFPVSLILLAIVLSADALAGSYGVALAAVAMSSTLGPTSPCLLLLSDLRSILAFTLFDDRFWLMSFYNKIVSFPGMGLSRDALGSILHNAHDLANMAHMPMEV